MRCNSSGIQNTGLVRLARLLEASDTDKEFSKVKPWNSALSTLVSHPNFTGDPIINSSSSDFDFLFKANVFTGDDCGVAMDSDHFWKRLLHFFKGDSQLSPSSIGLKSSYLVLFVLTLVPQDILQEINGRKLLSTVR